MNERSPATSLQHEIVAALELADKVLNFPDNADAESIADAGAAVGRALRLAESLSSTVARSSEEITVLAGRYAGQRLRQRNVENFDDGAAYFNAAVTLAEEIQRLNAVPSSTAASSIGAPKPVAWLVERSEGTKGYGAPRYVTLQDAGAAGFWKGGQVAEGYTVTPLFAQSAKELSREEAANEILAMRDQTVMSKYATQAECKAARDALWNAAVALRWNDSPTSTGSEIK